MKKLLSLTAAALLLITTGCGRSNAPLASASSAAPSVSAPITEPTVESSDDTAPTVQKDEAAAKPQNSRRLDDSRIIPLYSERFTYTDPYGEGKSGILFLIALDSRDYVTITYGGGVTAFTDYRIAQIEDKIVPMLSDGTYYKASETYIEMCADTLDFYAEKGAPLDSGNDPAKGWIKWVFVFVIPLAVACIVCGIFYAQMKTANEQTHANAYMPAEGLALSVVEDTYTHTTETETYDPVKNDSSSSSSGSSTDSDGFGGSSGGKF